MTSPVVHRPAITKEGKAIRLACGIDYPLVGLGTWKSELGKTGAAVKAAVRAGYRFIDTANDYNNEAEIGEALAELYAEGVVTREELFIQAKLWNGNHRPENVVKDLEATLTDLKTDYLDAFIIHWPQACPSHPTGERPSLRTSGAFPGHFDEPRPDGGCWMFALDDKGYYTSDNKSHYIETWKAMEELVKQKRVRAIGVSNFNKRQVQEVLDVASEAAPLSIVQNEIHCYFQQKDFVDFCQANGVAVQAFSPLGSSDRPSCYKKDTDPVPVLSHSTIQSIAKKHSVSPAQVCIRWHLQRGVACVPKSITKSRIISNYQVWDFALDAEDMAQIDLMNVGWQFLLWEATAGHPDYPFKDSLPHDFTLPKAPLATTTASL